MLETRTTSSKFQKFIIKEELELSQAMKIMVHHAAAVRNESHSEEDVTIDYWSRN